MRFIHEVHSWSDYRRPRRAYSEMLQVTARSNAAETLGREAELQLGTPEGVHNSAGVLDLQLQAEVLQSISQVWQCRFHLELRIHCC